MPDNEALAKALEQIVSECANGRPINGGDIEVIADAAEALSRLRDQEWRAIETAPKDGTPILAFHPMVGVYSTGYCRRWTGEPGEHLAGTYQGFPCGFWYMTPDTYPFGKWDCQPTHWMPVPAPPGER